MTSWKRLVIVSFSWGGAGFAIVLSIIAGTFLWYTSRPKPPKSWDTSAITATFDHIDTVGGQKNIAFYYVLENNTLHDFNVQGGIRVAVKLKEPGGVLSTFSPLTEKYLRLDYPIFIPANQRVLFWVYLASPYTYKGEELKEEASREERRMYREAVTSQINTQMSNLDGFALFDESNRFQINLPKGW